MNFVRLVSLYSPMGIHSRPSRRNEMAPSMLVPIYLGGAMTRFILIMLIPAVLFAQPISFEFADSLITKHRNHGHYELLIYESEFEGGYRILRDGVPVHTETGYRFHTSQSDWEHKWDGFARDVTGDGIANIVIWHWSGGNHCCHSATVFELGPTLKVLGRFDGEDSTPFVTDLDGDGIDEIQMRDSTFAYWNACYALSPQPQLIFRYHDRHYSLAPNLLRDQLDDERVRELMGAAPGLREEIQLGAKEAGLPQQVPGAWHGMEDVAIRFVNGTYRNERREKAYFEYESWYWLPSELWGTMLELIYCGRSRAAEEFILKAWPAGLVGCDDFLEDFRRQLALSPYWTELSTYQGFDF